MDGNHMFTALIPTLSLCLCLSVETAMALLNNSLSRWERVGVRDWRVRSPTVREGEIGESCPCLRAGF